VSFAESPPGLLSSALRSQPQARLATTPRDPGSFWEAGREEVPVLLPTLFELG